MELDVSYTFTIFLNFKSGRQGLRSKPFDKHCSTVHSILNEVKLQIWPGLGSGLWSGHLCSFLTYKLETGWLTVLSCRAGRGFCNFLTYLRR